METIRNGTRGLALLARLNWDRVFSALTVLTALLVGAWIGTFL